MTSKNLDWYKGDWLNDLRHGEGTKKTKTYTYKGGWVKNQKEGDGEEI